MININNGTNITPNPSFNPIEYIHATLYTTSGEHFTLLGNGTDSSCCQCTDGQHKVCTEPIPQWSSLLLLTKHNG